MLYFVLKEKNMVLCGLRIVHELSNKVPDILNENVPDYDELFSH